jgi:hypothetical protein
VRRASGLLLALAALLGGCGPGAGAAPEEVRLTVTDGFGGRTLLERPGPEVRGGDTVMRLLQRNAKVTTRFGGGFVQSIAGRDGGREGGRPVDWFFFVNGVPSDKGATAVPVRPGDRIWWDRHDWGATATVPAVVGSFPQPFVSGIGGKRFTTRLECDPGVEAACDEVDRRLRALGVVTGRSRPATEGGFENLRVAVGRWPEIRVDRAVQQLERGPKASGVYARVSRDGRSITALGAGGATARRLGPGTGLIAATRWRTDAPTWVVTGTDEAGIRQAASALDESVLAEKFALAISGGLPVALPAEPGGGEAR